MRRIIVLAWTGMLAGCLGSYTPGAPTAGGGSAGSSGASGSGGGGASGGGSGSSSSGSLTYYRDVLPILQKDCLSCHATGQAADPALDVAATASANAAAIAADLQSGKMPPYPPADGCNHYVGERRISASDAQLVTAWAQAGAPAGDPATAMSTPPAPTSGGGLALGTPDKHLVAGPFTPTYPGSAGADDLYWCFVLDPQLGAASDLTAMNIVPGQKAEVHHVIVFRDPGGQGSAGQPASGYECNGVPGEMLAGWVPGATPLALPSGVGMTISPGDKLLMQVHYHRDPGTTATADSTALDLYFAPQATPEHAWVVWAGTPLFSIPANTTGYDVHSTCTVNAPWKLLGVAPHMHQHATKFTSNMTVGGQAECLMNIPKWDFGWQGGYFLDQPVQLQPGDQITTTCTYDNNTGTTIKFGEATSDEMCFGFLYVVADTKPTFSGLVNLFGGQNAASMCAN